MSDAKKFPKFEKPRIETIIQDPVTGDFTRDPTADPKVPNQEVIDMFTAITMNPAYQQAIVLTTDVQGGFMLNLTSGLVGHPAKLWMALGQLEQAKAIINSVLQTMSRNPPAEEAQGEPS